jgi:hypothetical protein
MTISREISSEKEFDVVEDQTFRRIFERVREFVDSLRFPHSPPTLVKTFGLTL